MTKRFSLTYNPIDLYFYIIFNKTILPPDHPNSPLLTLAKSGYMPGHTRPKVVIFWCCGIVHLVRTQNLRKVARYADLGVLIRGVKNVSFSENFAYVVNEWALSFLCGYLLGKNLRYCFLIQILIIKESCNLLGWEHILLDKLKFFVLNCGKNLLCFLGN